MGEPLPELIVRADAHAAIGSGHVMRCLAIAEEWSARGGHSTFVGVLDEASDRRVRRDGHAVVALAGAHPDPDDMVATRRVIARHPAAVVIVDGYGFDPAYVADLHEPAVRMLFDDHATWPGFPCEVLVNAGFAAPATYAGRTSARLLLGPAHALVRRELREGAPSSRARSRVPPQNLLLTFGGSDPTDMTTRSLEAIGLLRPYAPRARCIVGPSNPKVEALRDLARVSDVDVVVAPPDMAPHLAWADVALMAAGSTSWELALFGVPMLGVVVADNQRPIGVGMEARGASRLLGDAAGLDASSIASAVAEAFSSPAALAEMSRNARALVDGLGAARIVDALLMAASAPR